MASIFVIEPASTSTATEFTSTSGGLTIVQTPSHDSSSNVIKCAGATGRGYFNKQFQMVTGIKVTYSRFYMNIESYPDVLDGFYSLSDKNSSPLYGLKLDTNGILRLCDSNWNQVGVNSSVLSLSTWYRVELFQDTTTMASAYCNFRIDGNDVGNTTNNFTLGGQADCGNIFLGLGVQNQALTAGVVYVSDIGLNDNSSSVYNTYLGALKRNYCDTYHVQGFQ